MKALVVQEHLAQLRDHIDVHRIIGLNVPELRESQISGALLGYLQKSAHGSLALYFTKIFEAYFNKQITAEQLRAQMIEATLATFADVEKAYADALSKTFAASMACIRLAPAKPRRPAPVSEMPFTPAQQQARGHSRGNQ